MFGEKWLRQRFVTLHGEGDEHQADVYRCYNCAKLRTWKQIRSGNVCCVGRVYPSAPKWHEAVRLFFFPWTF